MRVAVRVAAVGLAWGWALAGTPAAAAPAPAALASGDAPARASGTAGTAAASELGPWWVEGVRDPAAGLPGPWVRDLEQRAARLRRAGSSVRAIVPLLGAVPTLQGEVEPGRLRALLDEADKPGRHPLVRAFAASQRAWLDERAGASTDALAALEAQGWLLRWAVIGPFDNAQGAGHEQAFAPETSAGASDETFVGKIAGEPLAWRAIDYASAPRGGYISLDEIVAPNTDATAYATTWVWSPAPRDAALHLGTGGDTKVWVNGELVWASVVERLPRPEQDVIGLRLRGGWNRVLVKLGVRDGMWGLYARLSAPDGAPLAELRAAPEPPREGLASAEPRAPAKPKPPVSLRGELERAHAARPRDAAVALDLLEVLRWTLPDDARDDRAKRLALATDAQVRSSRSAWLLAQLHDDPAVTRAALDAGVERARKAPAGSDERALLGPLLYELALRTRSLGLERRARELLLEAAAAAPDDPTIELARIDVVATDGYSLAALAWLERLARRFPESSTVGDALVGQLIALGRTEAALARLQGGPASAEAAAGAANPAGGGDVGDLLQARRRIDALLTLGRPDDAVALARRIASAAPGLPSVHTELAHLEQARGELDAARTALAHAIALSPQDARLHAELGRLAARAGDEAGAIAALQRSLRLMPQQPAVRDLLAVLDAQAPADVFTRWAVALEEVASAPTPPQWQGKEAGILHERTAIRVLSNGLTERLEHRIVRILDDRGARNQAVQAIAYDPSETTVDLRRARVRRPDGTVEDLGRLQTASLTQAGYRMYYDQRQARAVFEGLRAGDVVEVAWVRRDIAARNMFDEYFGDVIGLQGLLPSLHTEVVIEAPASKPLFFNVPVAQEPAAAAEGEPALVRYRHVESDVPAIKPEPRMPGYAESARFLAVSTYRDWDEVGRWYWDLVDEQLVVDQAIRDGVREALAGLPPDAPAADKVARLYTHVVRTTRYVGLEFGIHGYKPYRTTDVYARRFGDCKDKASLLKVMLAEAGIVSHLVLVRTQDLGRMGDGPASLATFNHAIVYVPELDLYLDGTAEWAGPTELPAGDQGATVLVVKDGAGAELRTTPVLPAAANTTTTIERVALTATGDATVDHHITVAGADAASVRYAFQSADERAERLAQVWGQGFPGARVLEVRSPALDDIGRAAELRTRLQIPGWAQRSEGKGLRFKVTGQSSSLVQTYTPMTARTHPLVLDLPSVDVRELTVDVPPGYSLARVPSSAVVDGGPLGRFELEVRTEGRRATVRRALTLSARTVEPGQYGALREFLRKIDETLEQTIEVEVER